MIERFERCWCTGVDRSMVIEAVRRERCKSLDHLRRASGACFGCQSCRPELEALLEELWSRAEHATDRIERAAADAAREDASPETPVRPPIDAR